MDAKTKKILLLGGGAILIGAVGFFVYSFFKKDEFTFGNTTIKLNKNNFVTKVDEETNTVVDLREKQLPFSNISSSIGWTPTPISELWNKYK